MSEARKYTKPNFESGHDLREREATKIFADEGIIVSGGHFVYAAGGHGDAYVQKDKTLVDPEIFRHVTDLMTTDLIDRVVVREIDFFVGFAPCSSQHAARMAESLSRPEHKVRTVFMEKNRYYKNQ